MKEERKQRKERKKVRKKERNYGIILLEEGLYTFLTSRIRVYIKTKQQGAKPSVPPICAHASDDITV